LNCVIFSAQLTDFDNLYLIRKVFFYDLQIIFQEEKRL
jgi:hypothetical protein